MTDAQELAALLAVIYVFECVVRVPTGAMALARDGSSCRIFRPAEWTEIARGGFVVDDLLPPLDGHALLQPWTIALSPDGVASRLRGLSSGGGDLPVRLVPWEFVAQFSVEGSDLVLNHAAFARLASPAAAERVAAALASIAAASPSDRERAIVDALDARLDVDAVVARDAELRKAVARARISVHAVFATAVALVLGMAGVSYLVDWWPWFVVALVPTMAWTLVDFAYAHRRLFPGEDARRKRLLWTIGISPLGAVRAVATAGREAFAAWDPVAVAAAFCDADGFRNFTRRTLDELRHPPPLADGARDERAVACETWFRERMAQRIERMLRRRDVDPVSLVAPPQKSRDSIRGWCPRCRGQYERTGGCTDCGGLTLLEF